MGRDDDKQVQDALLAIKKLVEMSGDEMGDSDDVLTLDNVVWRNPVQDEAEEASPSLSDTTEAATEEPVDEPVMAKETPPKAPVAEAFVSVSSRDLDRPQKKTVVAPPATSPLELEDRAPKLAAPSAPDIRHPEIQHPDMPQPDISQEVTELTSPLGRRGGGFYSSTPPKPVIKAMAEEMQTERTAQGQAPILDPVADSNAAPITESPQKPALRTSLPHEPALTDFHGADFNFSAAEGLMTAASFSELNQSLTKPITADVQVPVAEPALRDPVGDVQAMYQETASDEFDSTEEGHFSSSTHPNLHVVSDQTQEADDEEEGFSGAVRLALRSIIKEQVSTWLQGNMTGLIEEALTSPQKRPRASSKPSSKKR